MPQLDNPQSHSGTGAALQDHVIRFIDARGRPCGDLPADLAEPKHLRKLYKDMFLTRSFDAKAVSLQRTGRLGTFASSLGQEAVAVGVAHAMKTSDVLLPSFREQGAQLVRGVCMSDLLLYWGGDERGNNAALCREDFPICIPVGSHAPHATGVALAFKLRSEPRVAVCVMGDGATSKGDVYEAMNFAGIHALPVVFVVNNNQWAISVPRAMQSAAETLAQKAIAAGFQGIQVDGNDVLAVQHTAGRAIDKARAGGGPTLVEALTYRLADHTTADDSSRYRNDTEVSSHWQAEPLLRLRHYMIQTQAWSHHDEQDLIQEVTQSVETAAETYLATLADDPETMFRFLYATLPRPLEEQLIVLRTRLSNRFDRSPDDDEPTHGDP